MLKRIVTIGCLLILLAQATFQVVLARVDSQTTDESVHVLAGYTYLTRGDYRFNPEHPPLVKILSAVPLLALKPNLPSDFEQKWQDSEDFFYDSWRENRYLGEQFFYNSGNNPDQLIFWSRIPMVAITLLLGLAILLIASRHFGAIGALVSVGFYALDPLVTGHGHLVTTDIAFGLGTLLTAYTAWRFLALPNWQRAAWLGMALGLALLTKHTAVILIVLLVVLAAWAVIAKKQKIVPILKEAGVALVLVWLMIWASHGFSARNAPPVGSVSQAVQRDNTPDPTKNFAGTSLVDREDLQLTDEELKAASQEISTFDKYYAPLQPIFKILPGDYLKGLLLVIGHSSGGHDSFLLGQISNTGWWYYFPLLLVLKLPLVTLAALLALIYLVIRQRPSGQFVATAMVFAGVFMLAAMSTKANLGLRHIFPVLPLVFVGFGWLTTLGKYAKELLLGLLIILCATFALAYPSYLGYFNELAGPKEKNYTIATDSNLDWGQDLKQIRNYIATNKLEGPVVVYDWIGQDALNYYLGANYRLLSETTLTTGDILIIGASAVNQPEYQAAVSRCGAFELITNGTFVCRITQP